MYEFTDKEIRKKFKETIYGKKTNKYLYISLTIFFSLLIFIPLICYIILALKGYSFTCFLKLFTKYINLYTLFMFIPLIFCLYFDGKRDGAIEQFKKNNTF